MLVLSRKKNESIVINDEITIVVVEIRGDKVRLGVEAPKEVPVHRREVYDAIKRSQLEREQNETAERSGCLRALTGRRCFPVLRSLPLCASCCLPLAIC